MFTYLRVRDIALSKSWIMILLQSICMRVHKLGRDKSPCWDWDKIIAFLYPNWNKRNKGSADTPAWITMAESGKAMLK